MAFILKKSFKSLKKEKVEIDTNLCAVLWNRSPWGTSNVHLVPSCHKRKLKKKQKNFHRLIWFAQKSREEGKVRATKVLTATIELHRQHNSFSSPFYHKTTALMFRAAFKWRLQENRFFLVFGLIIHFMATTTKAKRCIFISRTPKCPGAGEAGGAGRRYRLFSALLRSQFGPI